MVINRHLAPLDDSVLSVVPEGLTLALFAMLAVGARRGTTTLSLSEAWEILGTARRLDGVLATGAKPTLAGALSIVINLAAKAGDHKLVFRIALELEPELEALARSEPTRFASSLAQVRRMQAGAHIKMGNFRRAIRPLRSAIAALESLPKRSTPNEDTDAAAEYLMTLADALLLAEPAADHFEELKVVIDQLRLSSAPPLRKKLRDCLNRASEIALASGEFDLAISYGEELSRGASDGSDY
jgi:hypothetical protein